MRRNTVVLSVFCLLVFSGGAHAVTLQQGWYANIEMVDLYHYGPMWEDLLCSASFPTPVGTYWPFLVTSWGAAPGYRRYASVPSTVSGLGPENSLVLPIHVPVDIGTEFTRITATVSTNYDPAYMHVSFWHRPPGGTDELLWSRMASGERVWSGTMAWDGVVDGGSWYFKVEVAPEPSAFTVLVAGGVYLVATRRRR